MKKTFTLTLVVLLAFALFATACAKKEETTIDTEPAGETSMTSSETVMTDTSMTDTSMTDTTMTDTTMTTTSGTTTETSSTSTTSVTTTT